MQKAWAAKKGFTIIELLVCIVVIGILVTIMIVSYSGIQQRSRDSERGSDITTLKIAIEKYHSERGSYPDVCSGGDDTDCPASSLATALSPYLATIPHDPRNTADSATDYRYIRGAVTPSNYVDSYGIEINYEAKTTCKTGQNINAAWWGPAVPTC
jgi:prepilin-type N-terminal cleavage/methylation domain-containing protein